MITIEILNAGYQYSDGTVALDNIELTIEPGSRLAITGQNGAGKSTLAQLINGLLVPTSGRVLVDGLDTAVYPAHVIAAKVGYVFQDPRKQILASTVIEEVMFGPSNVGMPRAQCEEYARAALADVELLKLADKHPYELTHTQQKRLAMASVVAMNTPAVIFDEPSAYLDRRDYILLCQLLDKLSEQNKTVIVISHDPDFVADHCQQLVVLRQGRVLHVGSPNQFYAQSSTGASDLPSAKRLAQQLGLADEVCRAAELVQSLGK